VDAVDVEEIDARGDVSLNDLCAGGFDSFGQRGAIERSSKAIMVDAGLLPEADQREADAVEPLNHVRRGLLAGLMTGPRIFS
jgi:hypothetical protein